MFSLSPTVTPRGRASSKRRRFPSLSAAFFPATALLALALALAGCGGAGANEEGGNDGGGGDDGGDGIDLSAPAAPSGLSATSQDGAIGLGWDAVGGADTYRVYRSTSSGVDASGSPLDMGISPTEYTDETAENGTTYYYAVTAVAEEGEETAESSPSDEVEKTPFSEPPERP